MRAIFDVLSSELSDSFIFLIFHLDKSASVRNICRNVEDAQRRADADAMLNLDDSDERWQLVAPDKCQFNMSRERSPRSATVDKIVVVEEAVPVFTGHVVINVLDLSFQHHKNHCQRCTQSPRNTKSINH